jgi:hypothetical protein
MIVYGAPTTGKTTVLARLRADYPNVRFVDTDSVIEAIMTAICGDKDAGWEAWFEQRVALTPLVEKAFTAMVRPKDVWFTNLTGLPADLSYSRKPEDLEEELERRGDTKRSWVASFRPESGAKLLPAGEYIGNHYSEIVAMMIEKGVINDSI